MALTALTAEDRQTLATVSLFADGGRREAVLAGSAVHAAAIGETVVNEGDPPSAFYIVIAGALEVSTAAPSGPRALGTLQAGDWFGEEAIMRGSARTATVRALTPVRCLAVPADLFHRELLEDRVAGPLLRSRADVRLAERSLRSLAFFAHYNADEELEGTISRRVVPAGEAVFAIGAAADGMAFILDGIARGVASDGSVRMRLGPGQCAGEQDVLRGTRRLQGVVAETDVTVLDVTARRFREWVEHDADLADWVGTLQQMYRLADGRRLTVYEATVDGKASVVTVLGDPSTDGVMTVDRIGEDHLVIERCRKRASGDAVTETVRFTDGTRMREISVADVERNPQGHVTSGRLARLEVLETGPDVGQLYRRILTGDHVTARDLHRFRRTGHLGGTTPPRERVLLCQCLQIVPEEISATDSVDAVMRETGAGMVCKGCRPAIADLVADRRRPAPAASAVSSTGQGHVAVPEVRAKTFVFNVEPLKTVRAVPEVMLIAATSVLSTPAEQLVIAAIGEAAPRLNPELAAAVEALLAQESNHIAAHAPLNVLLLEEVYPYSGRLRRLGERMLVRYRDRSLEERVAIGAAYEYASDSIFAAYYELHYREGRRFHRIQAVHDALIASGVGPFFSWHGLEELTHRHVVFEVAMALGVTRRTLRWAMVRVLSDLARLQFPAVFELLRREPDARFHTFAHAALIDAGFVRLLAVRLAKWARADFDPGAVHYPFLPLLAEDVDSGRAGLPR